MKPILPILLAALLCGCEFRAKIASQPGTNQVVTGNNNTVAAGDLSVTMESPGRDSATTNITVTYRYVTNCYDLTDRRAYRIMTDGQIFRAECNSELFGWQPVYGTRATREAAENDITVRIHYWKMEQGRVWQEAKP